MAEDSFNVQDHLGVILKSWLLHWVDLERAVKESLTKPSLEVKKKGFDFNWNK